MLYLNEINKTKTFTTKEITKFLKAIKNNKYECFFKLIMAYQISRMELVNIKWEDIDFDNNTITIYPIKYDKNTKFYYEWDIQRKKDFYRIFPLLPNIKELLLELKEKQIKESISNENYTFDNQEYIALKDDGTRLNYNTLSRNLRSICRENNLQTILLSGLSISLNNFICKKARDYDYYRAWTRIDIKRKRILNFYQDMDLKSNKKFIKDLNEIMENPSQIGKADIQM